MSGFRAENLAQWTHGRWTGAVPAELGSISNDTRTIEPDALYVALKGARLDGHAFVEEAFRRGAAAALVNASSSSAPTEQRARLQVADTGQALLDMAAGYRRSLPVRVVGITGSVGKSSVKEMLAQILRRRYRTACTRGNWNNNVGLPLSILAMPDDTEIGVFEVGTSHPGEIAPLVAVAEPSIGLVTNVGPVHLEFFRNEAAIAEEKAALLHGLPADGLAVLNADGGQVDILATACKAPILTVALERPADYICRDYDAQDSSVVLTETSSGDVVKLSLPLPGEFVAVNAALAVAVARHLGVSWADIRAGLEEFEPLPMRWQRSELDGIFFVNDAYNANPINMRAALGAFASERPEVRKWLVLGDMLELGSAAAAEHRQLGQHVAAGNWQGLLTVGRLGALIAEGAVAAGMDATRVSTCDDNQAAADTLRRGALRGDAVLLKASRGIGLEEVVSILSAGVGHAR